MSLHCWANDLLSIFVDIGFCEQIYWANMLSKYTEQICWANLLNKYAEQIYSAVCWANKLTILVLLSKYFAQHFFVNCSATKSCETSWNWYCACIKVCYLLSTSGCTPNGIYLFNYSRAYLVLSKLFLHGFWVICFPWLQTKTAFAQLQKLKPHTST